LKIEAEMKTNPPKESHFDSTMGKVSNTLIWKMVEKETKDAPESWKQFQAQMEELIEKRK